MSLDSEFKAELEKFLADQGKTLLDLTESLSDSSSTNASPPIEPKHDTVPETVVKHIVSAPSSHRRRLRLFSGRRPVPNGEADFDNWRRQTQLIVDADDLSESEKISRLTEALLPPASNVVWALGKGVSAKDSLEGLEKAFGTTSDGEELYLLFTECYQASEEFPSDYLLRLQDLLIRAQENDGINAGRMDKARVHQFSRGCLYNDALLHTLALGKRLPPPDFVSLLHEVRQEEQKEKEKEVKRKSGQKGKGCHEQVVPQETDRVAELHEMMVALQHQISSLMPSGSAAAQARPEATNQRSNGRQRGPRKPAYRLICYNCGKDGHRMDECNGETNAVLVQQKIAARNQPAGNAEGRQ
ncbi:paraneoplastic antigen Ma3-like [Strongylocentrotus purpuratus]|uniref:CCHC-type domain-containing protein n=1 Tax=Strongylocentrotus purpuratus TaxID=7668 RepID=A0A7M7SY79_STRPU|nr:paraneoplastic antigen Ma3-like [Strongylocentrotus purpuratus]